MASNTVALKYRTLSTSSAYSSCSDDLDAGGIPYKERDNQFYLESVFTNGCHKRCSSEVVDGPLIIKHFDKPNHLPINFKRVRNNSSIGSLSDPALMGDYDTDCMDEVDLDEATPNQLRFNPRHDSLDDSSEMEDLGLAFQNLFTSVNGGPCELTNGLTHQRINNNRVSRKSVTFSESVQRSFFRASDTINRCRRKMHKVKLKEADDDAFCKDFKKEVYNTPTKTSSKSRRRKNKKIV